MATHPGNVATLLDVAKAKNPDGSPAKVAEILTQTNRTLEDIPWMQGNLETGHRTTIRTGLPEVYWRMINHGTPPSKAKTEQVDESCAMLDAWATVDAKLVELNGYSAAYRLGQGRPFLIAMNHKFNDALFYANQATDGRVFTGLEPRFSDVSAESGENIVECDTSPAGGCTSIWLVCWGENTVYGIYPKNSSAGINHEDMGRQVIESANGIGSGNLMVAYRDHYTWDCGLVVEDWRYVSRAANIDVAQLHSGSHAPDLRSAMIKMLWALPDEMMGRCAFYTNRTVLQALDLQGTMIVSGAPSFVGVGAGTGADVTNVFPSGTTAAPRVPYGAGSYSAYQGATQGTFRGIPVKRVDAIKTSETAV